MVGNWIATDKVRLMARTDLSRWRTLPERAWDGTEHVGRVIWRAIGIFLDTDGEQRAASFAYYAFFSLFPLVLLFVAIGSVWIEPARVSGAIISFLGDYIPVTTGDRSSLIVDTITGVVESGARASIIAVLGLTWGSLRFFQALVRGVNRAWGTLEYSWWRLPIKNLLMVGVLALVLLLGVLAPTFLSTLQRYWEQFAPINDYGVMATLFRLANSLLSSLVLFFGFAMFYKVAPRRKTAFRDIWVAALLVTLLLQGLRSVFVFYATSIGDFNRIYGAVAGVIALLMWVYISGVFIIFGACISAAQAELAGRIARPKATHEKGPAPESSG